MNIHPRKFTELSFPPWRLQIDLIDLNYLPSHPNSAMFKYLTALAALFTLAVTALTPDWAGAQTAAVQPSTVTPSELPTPAQILTQTNQPLQNNNSLNSLNPSSLFQNNAGSNIPGGGTGSTLGFTWSPNQPMADLQDQAKKNEIERRNRERAEARRQLANELATALEQKQYERARILAIQLVGVKNYRNFLLRITAGQFPNP
jgi:hypothetical protein